MMIEFEERKFERLRSIHELHQAKLPEKPHGYCAIAFE
jgi:hypothetical protein